MPFDHTCVFLRGQCCWRQNSMAIILWSTH